jgi:hypothetical protein
VSTPAMLRGQVQLKAAERDLCLVDPHPAGRRRVPHEGLDPGTSYASPGRIGEPRSPAHRLMTIWRGGSSGLSSTSAWPTELLRYSPPMSRAWEERTVRCTWVVASRPTRRPGSP